MASRPRHRCDVALWCRVDGLIPAQCEQPRWEAAKSSGEAYFPPTFDEEGFTHATGVPSRLIETANHFYQDVAGEWICLRFTRSALRRCGITVKDEEAKEAHEKELRRQHRLIAVLEAEEARARAFYEYEFANNLRERRDMKEADQETRLFVLESKSATGSKYDVGGVFIVHSNVLSPYISITTGTGVSALCSLVLALKSLQKLIMFTPCCPSAGPTGGDGFSAPAGTTSRTTALTARLLIAPS